MANLADIRDVKKRKVEDSRRQCSSLSQKEWRTFRYTRYDMIGEFNVNSKAECGQLGLTLIARNKKI